MENFAGKFRENDEENYTSFSRELGLHLLHADIYFQTLRKLLKMNRVTNKMKEEVNQENP
jgi:hypothetical protein